MPEIASGIARGRNASSFLPANTSDNLLTTFFLFLYVVLCCFVHCERSRKWMQKSPQTLETKGFADFFLWQGHKRLGRRVAPPMCFPWENTLAFAGITSIPQESKLRSTDFSGGDCGLSRGAGLRLQDHISACMQRQEATSRKSAQTASGTPPMQAHHIRF